jgi:hypothetical protein
MTYRPVIHTQADLEDVWRFLMRPLGFGSESLWFVYIAADGALLPHVTQVEQLPASPDLDQVADFVECVHEVVADQGDNGQRVAFLRSRPGGGGPTARDRAWAAALVIACREIGLPCEVVHLATDHDVVPLPGEDLMLVPA